MTGVTLGAVISFAAVVLLLLVVGALRRRPIAEAARREFARRPTQTVLVVASLVMSSAVLAAALVAGNSTNSVFNRNVFEIWGPIDAIVGSASGIPFSETEGIELLGHPEVASRSDGAGVRIYLPASVETDDGRGYANLVNLIGIDPMLDATLGSFRSVEGTVVEDPAGGAIVNKRLADRLGVSAGSSVNVFTAGFGGNAIKVSLPVTAVAENRGRGNFQLRPNVYVDLHGLQRAIGSEGVINQVVLSAVGPAEAPREIQEFEDVLLAVSNKVPEGVTVEPSDLKFRLAGTKSQSLRVAAEQSGLFRSVLAGLGALVALVSLVLVVNLFVMIGEDRRSERAILRALGLKRGGLILLGVSEGFLYAGSAAVLGAALGTFLGDWIGRVLISIFAGAFRDLSVEFVARDVGIDLPSFITAASIGFLVSVAAVLLVSWRSSRISIASALRGLDEPEREPSGPPIVAGGALVGGVAAYMLLFVLPPEVWTPFAELSSVSLAIVGLAGLIRRFVDQRAGLTLGALGLIAWGAWAFLTFPNLQNEFDAAFPLAILSAGLVVSALVVLISSNLRALLLVPRVVGSLLRAIVAPAVANASRLPFRTGMTMALFALIIYMIGAFAVWGTLGTGDLETQAGGYDVWVESSVGLPGLAGEGISDVAPLYSARYELGYGIGSRDIEDPVKLLGVDEAMASSGHEFLEKPAGFTDQQVWARLAASSSEVVLSPVTKPAGGGVGDAIVLMGSDGLISLNVIGVVNETWLGGLYVSKPVFKGLVPAQAVDRSWLVRTNEGVGPSEVAESIERAHPGLGLVAKPIEELLEEARGIQETFNRLFEVLLHLGLVVAIAGLSIAAARAVLERRGEIGILKAIGFRQWMVGATFILESYLVAFAGCIVGLVAGLGGTMLLIRLRLPTASFDANLPQVLFAVFVTLIAAGVFTALPAWRAARLNPAESVRIFD